MTERERERRTSDAHSRTPETAHAEVDTAALRLAPDAALLQRVGRAAGNQAVARLASSLAPRSRLSAGGRLVQAKLDVGAPGDAAEREADEVADRIARGQAAGEVGGALAPAVRRRVAADAPAEVAAPVETGIERARGRGARLPGPVQARMERSLGVDLDDVRVHADGHADSLSRALGARAFATGSDVFFRSGAYDPSSEAGTRLLAHELTHVVQQRGDGAGVVRRAVGFEFQTNWGIVEKEKGKHGQRKKLSKGQILHAYQGFNLTADEAGNVFGAEIEWVVDPPIPESAGLRKVDEVVAALEARAAMLVALQNQDSFMLDQATGDARDSWLEVHPKIKGAGNAQSMKANPQVTGGIRLDKIATLYSELQATAANDPHYEARTNLVGMGGAGLFGVAAAAANGIPGASAKLKGLAAQLIAYLRAGALMGMPASRGQAYDYAKLIGKLMARTDFGSQFKSLDAPERQPYEQDPDSFATLILTAANLPGGAHVFERGVKEDTNDPTTGVFFFPVSRKDWLTTITRGVDQLSSVHMPHWKSELEGLGALGDKWDKVGPGGAHKGVVGEFRMVQQQMPYTAWRHFANQVFVYLLDLNARP